jgi:hypothetical protein
MTYTTDNRWSTGSQRSQVPDDAPAAYGARWIDHGSTADIVPDRQGFAYNDDNQAARQTLIDYLVREELHRDLAIDYDEPSRLDFLGWTAVLRRSGGYVYVDAWLNPEYTHGFGRTTYDGTD